MATKRLYRSMVEGGHASHEQDRTRQENRRSRHATRQMLSTMTHDRELFDGAVLPFSEPAYDFDDPHDHSSRVALRWLKTRIGGEWGAVMSRLVQMQRMQSAYGLHLLRYYVTGQVDPIWERCADLGFHYDEHGILHDATYHWYRSRSSPQQVSDAEFTRWLGGRRVGRRGAHFYWFAPTSSSYWVVEQHSRYDYLRRCDVVDKMSVFHGVYRQDRELTSDEVALFDRLTSWQQAKAMEDLHIDSELKAA